MNWMGEGLSRLKFTARCNKTRKNSIFPHENERTLWRRRTERRCVGGMGGGAWAFSLFSKVFINSLSALVV